MAEHPLITSQQVRAARAWLDLSQQELAEASGVNRKTIIDFEKGLRIPFPRTLRDIRNFLEQQGIEFLFDGARGAGLRCKNRSPSPQVGKRRSGGKRA